MGLEKVMERD